MQGDAPPAEDVWRILIATDCHLGYMERDPVRRDDSFEAFDEILAKADLEQVDFVLLGGDLFHDNNPSRYTLHRTMEILKKHCFGDRPGGHNFEIISDQAHHFSRADYANVSDMNLRIKLPVFSIHGNHDDPGDAALAALDLLHISSMVNYFGKTDVEREITISPLMLQKGESTLALYGLGNIRDERLVRMWDAGCVHFEEPDLGIERRPSSLSTPKKKVSAKVDLSQTASNLSQPNLNISQHSLTDSLLNATVEGRHANFLKLLVLHQNRVPHSGKYFVTEDRVRGFDFVVWGHEHESIVTHTTRLDGEAYISQPGSSVATSLSEGETALKHAVLLQVWKNQYAITPLPLHSVRPFRLEHINLSTMNIPTHLTDLALAEAISACLAQEVERILKEISDLTCTDGSVPTARFLNNKLPLVRLKVNYTGYTVINSKRFGQNFLGRVANPSDILLFSSKRGSFAPTRETPGNKQNTTHSAQTLGEAEDLLELAPQHTNIDHFLHKQLIPQLETRLGVFNSTGLLRALHSFAEKENTSSLSDILDSQLKGVQLHVINQSNLTEQPNQGTGANGGDPILTTATIAQWASDFHKLQETKEESLFQKKVKKEGSHPKKTSLLSSSLLPASTAQSSSSMDISVKKEPEEEFVDDYDQYEAIDAPLSAMPSAGFSALVDENDDWETSSLAEDWEESTSPARGKKRGHSHKTETPSHAKDVSTPVSAKSAGRGKRSSAKKAGSTTSAKKSAKANISPPPPLPGQTQITFQSKNRSTTSGDPVVIDLSDEEVQSDIAFLDRQSSTINGNLSTNRVEMQEMESEPVKKKKKTVVEYDLENEFGRPITPEDGSIGGIEDSPIYTMDVDEPKEKATRANKTSPIPLDMPTTPSSSKSKASKSKNAEAMTPGGKVKAPIAPITIDLEDDEEEPTPTKKKPKSAQLTESKPKRDSIGRRG